MLIFGFGPGKGQDLGEVIEVTCPFCHNDVCLHHVRSKKAVRLYFVPVVPYGTDDYLMCPICGRGLQLEKQQLPLIEPMQQTTQAYRSGDLDPTAYRDQADQFWRNLGIRPGVSHSQEDGARVEPRAAADRGKTAQRSRLDQLRELERLHAEGVLDDAQFAAAKSKLVDGSAS